MLPEIRTRPIPDLEVLNATTTGLDFRDHYTAATRSIVARLYRRDIELFGGDQMRGKF